MPVYVTVLKSTAEAIKNMGDAEKWWKQGKETLEKMGVRVINAYALLGRYDMMFIYEAPDEDTAMSLALTSSTGAYLPSETWTAVPMEDFVKLANRLRTQK